MGTLWVQTRHVLRWARHLDPLCDAEELLEVEKVVCVLEHFARGTRQRRGVLSSRELAVGADDAAHFEAVTSATRPLVVVYTP